MKKKFALCIIFICTLTLVACADAGTSPVDISESQTTTVICSSKAGSVDRISEEETSDESGSSDAISEVGETSSLELDKKLSALLGKNNAVLKQRRQESCYAEISGRGTARALYFAPFLDAELIPLEEGVSTIWREGYSEGHQTENPFVDDLQVMELTIEDEIDPLTPTVIQQDSLRQLFVTDALITYSLLCESLGQRPELIHVEDVYYTAPISENWPLNSNPGQKIAGGEWRADFSVESLRISVNFIQTDGEFVAYRAVLSEK